MMMPFICSYRNKNAGERTALGVHGQSGKNLTTTPRHPSCPRARSVMFSAGARACGDSACTCGCGILRQNGRADKRVSRGQASERAVCVCEAVSVEMVARRPPLPTAFVCPPVRRRRRRRHTGDGSCLDKAGPEKQGRVAHQRAPCPTKAIRSSSSTC